MHRDPDNTTPRGGSRFCDLGECCLRLADSDPRCLTRFGRRVRLCLERTRSADAAGGQLVFVDESAEQVAATDMIELDHVGRNSLLGGRRLVERWPLREGAVWPVRVVVPRVGLEDLMEVTASEDQQPVEAFAADAADPEGRRAAKDGQPDAARTARELGYAASWYSWIRPPSRSRRRTRSSASTSLQPPRSGGCWASGGR